MASKKGMFGGTSLIRVKDEESKRKIVEHLERNGMADLLVQPQAPKETGMPEPLKRELAEVYVRHGRVPPQRLRQG